MLTFMTFNIKNNYHMEVKDGKISDRLTEILKIIEKENPDVLGLQEVTEEVKSLIDQNYINYEVIGRSRYNNGQKRDEYNLILVKKKLPILASDTYSLGKNIHKVGSKGMLDVFPRICTFVKIKYQDKIVNLYNTHLDHLLAYNRKRQLLMIKNIIELEKKEEAVVIMGDLNMSKGHKHLKIFLDEGYIDVVDNLQIPTFRNRYLDHILINNKFIVNNVYVNQADNYPSDHFPVIVNTMLK